MEYHQIMVKCVTSKWLILRPFCKWESYKVASCLTLFHGLELDRAKVGYTKVASLSRSAFSLLFDLSNFIHIQLILLLIISL